MISKLNWIKISVYSCALQCKKVQSSIEKFHWSKKLRKIDNFSFNLTLSVPLESVNLFPHVFFSQSHFDNTTLHKVTHNFHLKIRNILELTTCPVKFGTTCPSVIFLLATGSQPRCLRYLRCWLAVDYYVKTESKILLGVEDNVKLDLWSRQHHVTGAAL